MDKDLHVISWELPLAKGNDQTDTPSVYLQKLANANGGFYPMGANSLWHGGIHLDSGTNLKADSVINCIADGEVIAYRIDSIYPTVTAQVARSELIQECVEPEYQEEKAHFSSGFVLVRHQINMPSIETSVSAPVTTSAPTIVPAPDTASVPATAPAPTEQASDNGKIEPETPSSETTTLTFYSLYMHLCYWPFYEKNTKLKRPAYWGDPTEFEIGDQADDTILGCVVRENGAKTTILALLPRGTVITVGEAHASKKGWYKLASIDEGDVLNIAPDTRSVIGYYVYPGEMTNVENNQYKVAEKGTDHDKNLSGQRVYAEPEVKPSLLLSVLPRGAKVQIGERKGHWGKIEKLLTNKAYPTLPSSDDGKLQGWINLTKLTAVIQPLKMDEVKVLEKPCPIKAGELIGYPGIYQKLGDTADPATDSSALLVHLEVFTSENMPAFIKRTEELAEKQKEDKKALIKVNSDAILYQILTADKEIASDMQVAKVDQSRAKGKWLEVKKERTGTVDKKYLSGYKLISQKPLKAEYTISTGNKQFVASELGIGLAEIPDKVFFYGECLNNAGERVTTTSPTSAHPLREIHFTPKNDTASYWIEANKLDVNGKKVNLDQIISVWSKYPLKTDNRQEGTVFFEQVFTKTEIEETDHWANDPEGTFWWLLKTGKKDSVTGTGSFGEVEGWVKEAKPGVTRHHPWEWPLFHALQETATPAQKLERNQRLRLDPGDRTTLMNELYKILGGTTRQIADTEEQEDTNLLKTENLKTALRYPWLSQQFSHLIVNYESEWFADKGLSKWHEVDDMLKKYVCQPRGETETACAYKKRIETELKPWQAEKEQRIKKLLWWDKVAGQHGFPSDAKVWHLHPVGMAENFWIGDNDPGWLIVPRGQFTFDVEGNDIERNIYFSRVAHWPGGASGITIGRGYDLGQRVDTLENDLASVGITGKFYDWLVSAKGLKGDAAKNYLKNASQEIRKTQITRKQQYYLFSPVYDYMKDEVIIISSSAYNVEHYGKLNWDKLDSRIQDIVIDLIYRGDYTVTIRKHIQKVIVQNDITALRIALADRTIWLANLPEDRYQRRVDYMR